MNAVSQEWAELALPTWLPELVVTPDAMQIFMFSAVTWNRHHIHYNRDAAIREGLSDIAVQRALLGNFFARLLTQWGGPATHVQALSWKVQRSAFPGKPLRARGVVTNREIQAGHVCLRCSLTLLDDADQTVATGAALMVPSDMPNDMLADAVV